MVRLSDTIQEISGEMSMREKEQDRNCVKLWGKEYAAVDYCELITPTSAQLPGLTLPEGVTVHSRRNENGTFIFVENYEEKEVTVNLLGEYEDMETGEKYRGEVRLEGFGVKILKSREKT